MSVHHSLSPPITFNQASRPWNRAPCEAGAGSGVSEGRPQWLFTWPIRILTLIRMQCDDAETVTLAGLPLISNCHSKVDILLLSSISLLSLPSPTGGGEANPGWPSGEKRMRGRGRWRETGETPVNEPAASAEERRCWQMLCLRGRHRSSHARSRSGPSFISINTSRPLTHTTHSVS